MERARHRKSKNASAIEGIGQIHKFAPRLSTDSRPYIDGSKKGDLFMLEFRQSSWQSSSKTQMKKLLAEEMPRKQQPSVISRLMGLEGLPFPRQVRVHQPKSRSTLHYDGRMTRSPPEFKDVYEDTEAARASRHQSSSRWIEKKLSSTDKMERMLKHLWHRDSPGNRIAVSNQHESKAKPRGGSHVALRREDGILIERHGHHQAYISPNLSRDQSKARNLKKIIPTRIVVLKPNLGEVKHRSRRLPDPVNRSPKSEHSSSDMGLSRSVSKEARVLARAITMRMRDMYDETNDSRSLWVGGYAGDESSYEANESCSESQPEGFGFSHRQSFGPTESSANKEARKRLPRRWWMTHNYRGMDVVNINGSTLGEMHALPGRETKTGRSRSNARTSPSGISRVRRNHKTSSNRDELAEEKVVTHSETVVDVMTISEPVSTVLFSGPSKLLGQKEPPSVVDGDECAAQELGGCRSQDPAKRASPPPLFPVAEPDPSESSKEAYHPSPNSVLETTFMEDTSSAESFDRVSHELHELGLQLQLLEKGSSTDADVSKFFPIEEADVQAPPIVCERNCSTRPSGWKIHYVNDVIFASGLLQDPDFSMYKASWHSPHCPLDPKLFDALEDKHSDDGWWSIVAKWERKLVFDWIYSALEEMFVEHVDSCPWVMPKSVGSTLVRWLGRRVSDTIEKVIEQLDGSGEDVDREMGWVGPTVEVEMVGEEIERLLMDDMVAEALLCA